MGASSSPHPVEPAASAPAHVLRLAGEHRLGPLVAARKGDNPVVALGVTALIAAGLSGLAVLIGWAVRYLPVRALGMLALLCVLGAIFAVAYGFHQLFQGFRATYLFHHGIVWTFNGRPQAVVWAEVERLFVVRQVSADRYVSAEVTLLDGRTVPVAGSYKADDPVIARLSDAVRAEGRPVTTAPARPARSSGRETGVADQTLVRVVAFSGVIGSLVLGFVGWRAGVPGPVAAVASPFLVGTVVLGLGYAVDARLAVPGYVFMAAAGLVLVIVMVRVLEPVNGFVVAVLTLAAEAALVTAWRALYRRLPALRSTRKRRRLAAELGWQFQPRATSLPVTSPHTARRLIGVPSHARTTTGAAVLHGSSVGSAVTVYDRFRRRPRVNDPVQTVWMVRLPLSLPFVASSIFGHLSAEARTAQSDGVREHTDDEAFARAFAAQVWASATSGPSLPPWWIDDGYLYAAVEGASDDDIRPYTERLAGFVAAFPWPALRQLAGAAGPAY